MIKLYGTLFFLRSVWSPSATDFPTLYNCNSLKLTVELLLLHYSLLII